MNRISKILGHITNEDNEKDKNNNTLSIVDNRTGKQYECEIESKKINSDFFKNLKTDDKDIGIRLTVYINVGIDAMTQVLLIQQLFLQVSHL